MSESYTKLSSTLVHSTVWRESAETRVVWITLLALADQHGEVQASIPGLADAARVTLSECETALAVFLAPDTYSRNQTLGGRRMTEIPGGWFIVNYDLYRGLLNLDHRRALARDRQARHRSRNAVTRDVTHGHEKSRQAEAEAEAEAESKKTALAQKAAPDTDFEAAWALYPKRSGGNSKSLALKAWRARLAQNIPAGELLAGVERYAAYAQATGKIGTEYVKQAAAFFGPGSHWAESWDIPASNGPTPRITDDSEFVRASSRLQEIASYRDPVRSQALTVEGWKIVTPAERAAIKAIGTIERVLTAKPDQWSFVVRDFLKAQRGAA